MVNLKSSEFFKSNETQPILTTASEIKSIIQNNIGSHGAPGNDQITNKALKNLPEEYFSLLSTIFNASLTQKIIPAAWKSATVVMIPKPQKDHTQPSNHRPISLLTTMSKLLERIILARLQKMARRYQLNFKRTIRV